MNKYQVLALLAILYMSFFHKSGAIPAVDLGEIRNFVTVREMWEGGNWLIPTMNGELRITKPPLPTWLTLAGARIGGGVQNLSAMRFPAALIAVLMVLFTFYLGRALEFDASTAFRSALILSTSYLVIERGRIATWDIFAHSFMMGSLWALVSGIEHSKSSWRYLTLAGIFLGLSFLSKGPVAFYTTLFPFMVCYAFIYKPTFDKGFWKQMIWMTSIFLVIGFSWYAYIFYNHPGPLKAMLEKETAAWVSRHVGPPWYYIVFPLFTGIWAIGCVAALVKPFAEQRIRPVKAYSFLLWWSVLTLLLLSVLPEKKNSYLLPFLLPVSLMLGHLWTYWINAFKTKTETVWDRRVISIHTISVISLSFFIPWMIAFGVYKNLISIPGGILFGAVFTLIGGMSVRFLQRKTLFPIFAVTVILVCASNLLVWTVLPHMSYAQSEYAAMRGVGKQHPIADLPIYSLAPMNIRSIWEIGRAVKLLNLDEILRRNAGRRFALFTTEPPSQIIGLKDKFNMDIIGVYPGSRKIKDQKWYVSVLSPHVLGPMRLDKKSSRTYGGPTENQGQHRTRKLALSRGETSRGNDRLMREDKMQSVFALLYYYFLTQR